jgi:hypothetical protein
LTRSRSQRKNASPSKAAINPPPLVKLPASAVRQIKYKLPQLNIVEKARDNDRRDV